MKTGLLFSALLILTLCACRKGPAHTPAAAKLPQARPSAGDPAPAWPRSPQEKEIEALIADLGAVAPGKAVDVSSFLARHLKSLEVQDGQDVIPELARVRVIPVRGPKFVAALIALLPPSPSGSCDTTATWLLGVMAVVDEAGKPVVRVGDVELISDAPFLADPRLRVELPEVQGPGRLFTLSWTQDRDHTACGDPDAGQVAGSYVGIFALGDFRIRHLETVALQEVRQSGTVTTNQKASMKWSTRGGRSILQVLRYEEMVGQADPDDADCTGEAGTECGPSISCTLDGGLLLEEEGAWRFIGPDELEGRPKPEGFPELPEVRTGDRHAVCDGLRSQVR